MNLTIFIPMLFILQLFYWYVGKRAAKRLDTQEDYFLAGKSVSFFPLMMTFLATQVGGGLVLGASDEAYKFGWPVLLYPLGAALGLILLGSGIGRRLAEFKVSTVAQIFEVTYQSRVLRKAASLLSIVSLFMILVAQIIASSKFLVSLGFHNTPLFILFWAIVIIYTVQGGLKAVISTDKVQAAFFSLVFLLCFGFVFSSHGLPSYLPTIDHLAGVSSKLTGWLLMPLLFMVIEQDMGQRCFSGSSSKVVTKAALFAGIATLIVSFVPVYLGILASKTHLMVAPGSSVLIAVVAKTTGPWMAALVGSAILAAIISTATSLINAIGSNLSMDFAWSRSKTITAIISVAAIFFAFYFDNIVDLLIQSYDLSVSCLFVPLFIALFKPRGNYLSALLSILLGALGFFLFRHYPVVIPKEIASILLSLVGFGAGELYARLKAA